MLLERVFARILTTAAESETSSKKASAIETDRMVSRCSQGEAQSQLRDPRGRRERGTNLDIDDCLPQDLNVACGQMHDSKSRVFRSCCGPRRMQ